MAERSVSTCGHRDADGESKLTRAGGDGGESEPSALQRTRSQEVDRWRKLIGNPIHVPTLRDPVDPPEDEPVDRPGLDSVVDRKSRGSVRRVVPAGCVLVLAMVLAGCGASEPKTIPNIKGMSLDFAKGRLESAGIEYDYDRDQGALGILDESNWKVCGTDPPIGTTTNAKVWLIVRHYEC